MTVTAHAALQPGSELTNYEFEPADLGPLEVDVAVTHCGVCHTDIVMIDNEWGLSSFPVVAGHEIVGVVTAVGTQVDTARLAVGRRVGVGGIVGSCMHCDFCLGGRQQLCAGRVDTAMRGHLGGFADSVRASDWRFVYPLPASMTSAHAAPLLCAGATVFASLVRNEVRPTDRVAVVGIGGLGHLAVQFAAAWGCEVTAVSGSAAKRDEAARFGAHEFIATDEPGALAAVAGKFDFVMSTVPADVSWDSYVEILRPQGTLSIVGVPSSPISVAPFALLPVERRMVGGLPASPQETVAMLDFAARHNITPVVEQYSVADINTAVQRARTGAARYRAVVEF